MYIMIMYPDARQMLLLCKPVMNNMLHLLINNLLFKTSHGTECAGPHIEMMQAGSNYLCSLIGWLMLETTGIFPTSVGLAPAAWCHFVSTRSSKEKDGRVVHSKASNNGLKIQEGLMVKHCPKNGPIICLSNKRPKTAGPEVQLRAPT